MLDAARIPAEIVDRGRACLVLVGEEDLSRAVDELDDYVREGLEDRPSRAPVARPGAAAGALCYFAVLVGIAGLAGQQAFGADWFDAGRAQAGQMTDGQWWRAVTALTLHVDTRHLIGNVVFGSVLGFLAAHGLGAGVAWLAILIGGAIGNLANALLQQSTHSAVGASTAVFAALGLLVALALLHRRGETVGALRRWSPLVAGVLLLAWTGMGGERTDVLAHVTGLLAGLLVGAACGLVPLSVLERSRVQAAASVVAVLVLALAWLAALAGVS